MHLPRLLSRASLTIRQDGPTTTSSGPYTMPSTYCAPFCPNCHEDVRDFSINTSCVSNSSFIANCGACQQCIITYAIEKQSAEVLAGMEGLMNTVLDLCRNTSVAPEVIALEDQASRLSLVGDYIFSTRTSSSSTSHPVTPTSTPAFTTSISSASSSITPAPVAQTSSSVTQQTPNTTIDQPLSKSWVVGPVVGSVLGMLTVIIVIYFTRRKQRRDAQQWNLADKPTDLEEDDSGESTQSKPQLHAESLPAKELETNEVFELPAREPVGSELTTPMEESATDWPLPITPLRAMFVQAELQDERAKHNDSPKHDTYYHS